VRTTQGKIGFGEENVGSKGIAQREKKGRGKGKESREQNTKRKRAYSQKKDQTGQESKTE